MAAGPSSSMVAKFLTQDEDISPAQEKFMKGIAVTSLVGESEDH
jgi:hypothetical protein